MAPLAQEATTNGGAEVASFHQFYTLSPENAAKGARVRLKGTVLCYDKGWNQLYIHDGTHVGWLSPLLFQSELKPGWKVEITGKTTFVQGSQSFTNLQFEVLETVPLPEAKQLTIPELASAFGQWVQIQGLVRVAESSSGRLALIVQDGGLTCLVYVMGAVESEEHRSLLGCQVLVRGINASKAKGEHLESASITAPGRDAITLVEKGLQPEAPLLSIDTLLTRTLGSWTNEPVKLTGVIVSYKPGESLVMKDATGLIRARVIQTTSAQEGERVELWGRLNVSSSETSLRDAYFAVRRSEPIPLPRDLAQEPPENQDVEPLADTAAIARIPRETAALGLPVKLHGIVTYADPDWRISFLQDRKGAIFIDLDQRDVLAGQLVEVTGRTSRGGYAPQVVNASIRALGTTNLPVPVNATLQDLASGHLDSHWTQLEGVVRRVSEQWGHVTLSLTTPGGRFKAVVLKGAEESVPNLIDALVSVRGAVTSEMNTRGQLNGVILYVPGFEQLNILEPVPADPFVVPAVNTASVATFDPARLAGRRVRVRGSVTLIQPNEGFYVQDEAGGIRVDGVPDRELEVGDRVDVLGFPAIGAFSPSLEEAAWRRIDAGQMPKPFITGAEEILLQGTNDGRFVQIDARLVQRVAHSARPKLLLQSGSIVFTASVMKQTRLSELRPGSQLRLRGVCVIQASDRREPESLRLLVSDSEGVVLLRAPPWWTIQNTLMVVGALLLGSLLAWLWNSSLRRQVQAQTEVIRRNEQQLITISRQAGMAEVATSVLHNVGNVLNSVNVSVHLAADIVRRSKISGVARAASMLEEHSGHLAEFVTGDPRGQNLPGYLAKLGEYLAKEQAVVLAELKSLASNIEHINDIVAMQQTYAKAGGVTETIKGSDLFEDALRMNASALERHEIKIHRQYDAARSPTITLERNKALQILLNLITNAKQACTESAARQKRVTLAMSNGDHFVRFTCSDNGVGIAQENLTRIFSHGFTTRKNGHGFGLHGAALAAREMGGRLLVHSDGPGRGATFTLELPQNPKRS